MALKLFNTRSRAIEELQPRQPGRVAMYCCGPTVHNFAHIGNFRTFVSTDLLRRYLQFKGFAVDHVMNITDVEDKIIKAVQATGRKLRDYTGEYEAAFLQDFDSLAAFARTISRTPPIISRKSSASSRNSSRAASLIAPTTARSTSASINTAVAAAATDSCSI
jgi:cysteinyl-tRNA synthetase